MALFAIRCRFKPTKDSEYIEGMAICSDADTPVTFIHPDGLPLISDEIWDYKLEHGSPWAQIV